MTILACDLEQGLALGDEPYFPDSIDDCLAAQRDGPVKLREWGTYYLRWYGERPKFIDSLPTSPFAGRQVWSGPISEINFTNYVGLAPIGPFQIHVENQKIGDDLFHALLDNVADHYADLIFGFSKDPVGHSFRRHGAVGHNPAYVEYLFLRRFLLTEKIEGIVAAILRNPHTRMLRESRSVPLAMARATDPVSLLGALCRGDHIALLDTGHELCGTPLGQVLQSRSGRALFPSEVPEDRRYHTWDTHENRFAKHVLEDLAQRLDQVSAAVAQHDGNLVNPEVGSDLEGLKCKVNGCLDDPLWREVGPMRFLPQASPVLQRREGYRQLYRLHALLQLLTRYDYDVFDFEHLLETKDTATLYEYWCFFQIKEVLDGNLQQTGAEPLTSPSDTRTDMCKPVCVRYDGGLTLCFNWKAPGSAGLPEVGDGLRQYTRRTSSSGLLKPDIVIEQGDRRLVLDAKYKGRRGNEFWGTQDDGTIQTPKPEDLNKMHAYRDAIAGVEGAFALFPGTDSRVYPAHGATRPWEGVGALALRPGLDGKPNDSQVESIRTLIREFAGL